MQGYLITIFQKDQGMLYRKTKNKGRNWEDNTKTPKRKSMGTVAKKIRPKVMTVQEIMIT